MPSYELNGQKQQIVEEGRVFYLGIASIRGKDEMRQCIENMCSIYQGILQQSKEMDHHFYDREFRFVELTLDGYESAAREVGDAKTSSFIHSRKIDLRVRKEFDRIDSYPLVYRSPELHKLRDYLQSEKEHAVHNNDLETSIYIGSLITNIKKRIKRAENARKK